MIAFPQVELYMAELYNKVGFIITLANTFTPLPELFHFLFPVSSNITFTFLSDFSLSLSCISEQHFYFLIRFFTFTFLLLLLLLSLSRLAPVWSPGPPSPLDSAQASGALLKFMTMKTMTMMLMRKMLRRMSRIDGCWWWYYHQLRQAGWPSGSLYQAGPQVWQVSLVSSSGGGNQCDDDDELGYKSIQIDMILSTIAKMMLSAPLMAHSWPRKRGWWLWWSSSWEWWW